MRVNRGRAFGEVGRPPRDETYALPGMIFCTGHKGRCKNDTGSWETHYSIGAISRAPTGEEHSLGIGLKAYVPRATSKWEELRLRVRVERFQIFYKIKSARSAP